MEGGATLVLVDVEHWDEPTAEFCDRLGRAMAADVQTFAYLTAPDQFGSQPHRDEAHVFVVQVEGSKQWTLYDVPDDDNWRRGWIPENTPVSEQFVLQAGDGLYLPPGMGHRAQAGPDGSLHLIISAQTPSVGDVVTAWAKRLPLGSRPSPG
jgi:ribosomal protein L16 Arg81 hydroxylase